jgi:hypothetical protein
LPAVGQAHLTIFTNLSSSERAMMSYQRGVRTSTLLRLSSSFPALTSAQGPVGEPREWRHWGGSVFARGPKRYYVSAPGEIADSSIEFPDIEAALLEAADAAILMARDQLILPPADVVLEVRSDDVKVAQVTVKVLIERTENN